MIPEAGQFEGKTSYEVATQSAAEAFHVYLFEQIAMGNNTVLQRLLDAKISPNLKDHSPVDDSLIHWAASFTNAEATKILVAGGADVNQQNNSGQTCLHVACKSKAVPVMTALMSLGADPTIKVI